MSRCGDCPSWVKEKCDKNLAYDECVDMLQNILYELPSINIVRCKECKKAHLTYDGECKYCDEWKDDDGNYIEVYHDGNHYCSYGERKEGK